MADRYLLGGTWTSTAAWSETSGGPSGASVPTIADRAIVDGINTTASTTVTGTLSLGSLINSNIATTGNLFTVGAVTLTINGTGGVEDRALIWGRNGGFTPTSVTADVSRVYLVYSGNLSSGTQSYTNVREFGFFGTVLYFNAITFNSGNGMATFKKAPPPELSTLAQRPNLIMQANQSCYFPTAGFKTLAFRRNL